MVVTSSKPQSRKSLAETHPELAAQADGWDPTTVFEKSDKKRMWKCSEGHSYSMQVKNMALGSGCPICLNDRIVPGINDLATTHPKIAAQASGWDPTTVSRGATLRRKWRCDIGHEWIAYVSSRSQGHGCPSCSISGFDPNKDGWLYFLSHPNWEMLQIGITNVPDDRLGSHKKLGWDAVEINKLHAAFCHAISRLTR